MPPWLSQISSFQRKESKVFSSNWLQLATLGIDNYPRVRSVVFRGWSDSYEMKIFTDIRSQKYREIEVNNSVEICWLFTKSKCQFRFRGNSTMTIGKDSLDDWNSLSDKAKELWGWPPPGEIKNNHNKTNEKKFQNINNIDNFVLLKINIFHVDQLILHNKPHIRKRWIKKNDWIEETINP